MTTQSVERKIGSDGNAVDSEITAATSTASSAEASAASTASNSSVLFTPTQEWLDSVKGELPLNTIMRLIKYLGPQLEEISAADTAVDEKRVLDFIQVHLLPMSFSVHFLKSDNYFFRRMQRTTLVGLLPVPHPIVIRKYQPNRYTSLWYKLYIIISSVVISLKVSFILFYLKVFCFSMGSCVYAQPANCTF
jgi:hypothetical protein